MSWKQLKEPNLDPVIYSGGTALMSWAGWWLAYVEVAFGTPRLYESAWKGWLDARKRHEDRNFPRNVYFPVWFSHSGSYGTPPRYDNWGHVAIARVQDNGSMVFWSSPASGKPYADTYTSIEQVERTYNSKYVGWSEDIARVQVIEQAQGGADDMTIIVRPIATLQVKVAMPIMMFDFEHNKQLWESGHEMTLTQKTNIINGSTYYVSVDRAESGELYGFREEDVYAKGNTVTEAPAEQRGDPAVTEKARKYDEIKKITG